jgi:hypothetical protein
MSRKRTTETETAVTAVDVVAWPILNDLHFTREELAAAEESRVWIMYRKALRDRLRFLNEEMRKRWMDPPAAVAVLGKIMGLETALKQFETFYERCIHIPANLPDESENEQLNAALAVDQQRAEREIRQQLEQENHV